MIYALHPPKISFNFHIIIEMTRWFADKGIMLLESIPNLCVTSFCRKYVDSIRTMIMRGMAKFSSFNY
jgi:hypothetical protein